MPWVWVDEADAPERPAVYDGRVIAALRAEGHDVTDLACGAMWRDPDGWWWRRGAGDEWTRPCMMTNYGRGPCVYGADRCCRGVAETSERFAGPLARLAGK